MKYGFCIFFLQDLVCYLYLNRNDVMQKITCLLYAIIILLFFNLTFSSCKEEPPVVPPPPPPDMKDTITITIVEEMHRSIVVNVKTTTNFPNSFIELCRTFNNTDTLVAEYPITVTDTTRSTELR